MSTVIVVLLLVGFALCVTVGLLTVLQNLHTASGEESSQGPVFHDHSVE
jgi:hypothetical protein